MAVGRETLYGVTSDGWLLLGRWIGATSTTETELLLDPDTGHTTVIRDRVNTDTNGVPWAAGDRNYVILMEAGAAYDSDPGIDWRMLSYSRRTGQITQIATAPRVRGWHKPPAPPGYPQPYLWHGRVYWLQAANGPHGPRLQVASIPEAGGTVRVEMRDVWQPVPTDHGLYAMSSGVIHKNPTGGGFRILRKNQHTVSTVFHGHLTDDQAIAAMTASDTGVAWIVVNGLSDDDAPRTSSVFVLKNGATTPIEIRSRKGESWAYLASSSKLLVWVDGSQRGSEYAAGWDGSTRLLARASGLDSVVIGPTLLAWAKKTPTRRSIAWGTPSNT